MSSTNEHWLIWCLHHNFTRKVNTIKPALLLHLAFGREKKINLHNPCTRNCSSIINTSSAATEIYSQPPLLICTTQFTYSILLATLWPSEPKAHSGCLSASLREVVGDNQCVKHDGKLWIVNLQHDKLWMIGWQLVKHGLGCLNKHSIHTLCTNSFIHWMYTCASKHTRTQTNAHTHASPQPHKLTLISSHTLSPSFFTSADGTVHVHWNVTNGQHSVNWTGMINGMD